MTGMDMKKAAVLVVILVLAGCVATGRNFGVSGVKGIHNKTTTRSQVQEMFGLPYMTGIDNGSETWIYNYNRIDTSGRTQTKNLYIIFDKEGVVTSHTFSTSFPEEMSVTMPSR